MANAEKDPYRVAVGQRIRDRRQVVGIRPTEMAKRVGLTYRQYARIEAGGAMPRTDNLQKIAKHLGVDVAEITADVDVDPSTNELARVGPDGGITGPFQPAGFVVLRAHLERFELKQGDQLRLVPMTIPITDVADDKGLVVVRDRMMRLAQLLHVEPLVLVKPADRSEPTIVYESDRCEIVARVVELRRRMG